VDADHAEHYGAVALELVAGSVVPLLGAGINLCGRPPDLGWSHRHVVFGRRV
jgi:hypothetical protein